jgi:prevent-host-death family protein
MGAWPVRDAKSRFRELLEAALSEGPQVVTRRGVETAVLVPIEEWRRLREGRPRNLKDVLLGPGPRFETKVGRRRKIWHRGPLEFA